jgi:hypothetical protein
MELNGALSNPLASNKRLHMARVAAAESDISLRKQAPPDRRQQRLPRRQGSVLAAVTRVLEQASTPVRAGEIHMVVEELLGERVAYSTVKDALSAHSGRDDHRFRRTRHGCYELSKQRL